MMCTYRSRSARWMPKALLCFSVVLAGVASAQVPPPPGVAASDATNTNATFPIDLPTALKLVGAQNLDVQLAQNAAEEARANHTSALERFLPAIVPAASYLRHTGRDQAVDGTIVDVTKHNDSAGVYLSAQIPVGEAIFQSLQSRQLVYAADAGAMVQSRDSGLQAAQEYFELVRARAQVEIVRDGLAVSQDYERQLNEAVRIGIAFKGDAFRVQTQSQRLQLDLTRALQQQQQAAAKLVQTLHLDPMVTLAPADREPLPLALENPDAAPQALLKDAFANRPEIARSAALIAAAEQAHRAAVYGPLIPNLGGQAFGGQFNGGPDDTSANGSWRRDYSVGLTWRIGPGGLFDVGRMRSSSLKMTQAELTDEKLRDQISREVLDEYTRVHSLFEQLRVARTNLDSARETLRLTRDRKQLGVGTVLEDIQAQQELVRARSDYIAIVTQLNQEQYALMRNVGTHLHAP